MNMCLKVRSSLCSPLGWSSEYPYIPTRSLEEDWSDYMQSHQADSPLYVWPDIWSADFQLTIYLEICSSFKKQGQALVWAFTRIINTFFLPPPPPPPPPHTHTHTCNIYIYKQIHIPVEGIRLLDAACLLLGKRRPLLQQCGLSLVSSAPKKWRLTRRPFQKRTPQGQFRGPPTYTHQVWWRSIKGPRRSRGINRQTLLEL